MAETNIMTFKEFKVWYQQQDPLLSGRDLGVYPPAEDRPFNRKDVVREYLEREEYKEIKADAYVPPVVEATKKCSRCGRELLSRFFYGREGHKWTVCTDCLREERAQERMAKIPKYNKPMTTKVCKTCSQELPIEEFSSHPKKADGHFDHCKKCMREIKMAGIKRRHNGVEVAVPVVIEEPGKAVADDSDPALPKPIAEALPDVNHAPYNTIEIPASGWLSYVPDDVLYAELVARGWVGDMHKTLRTA